MTNMIHAALPGAAQQFNVSRPAKAHHEPKNNSSQFDKGYYRAKDFVHSSIIPARLNLVKSQLQSLIEQDETRRLARVALTWCIRFVARGRLFRALVHLFRVVKRIVKPVVITGLLAVPVQPLLLAARSVTSIDTSPLILAAQRKELAV